jgi:hypothetical protein
MMAMLMLGLFLLGPFAALGLWLWLRSRREPIVLVEAFDIGRVMGQSFAVFGREGRPIALLALLLVGLPQAVWAMLIRAALPLVPAASFDLGPNAQAERMIGLFRTFPAMVIAGMVALLLCSLIFYIAAVRFWARHGEGRDDTLASAIRLVPGLLLPTLAVALLAYVGVVVSLMLFVVPGVVIALSWFVAVPVMVNERIGVFEAFRRSRALAMGSRGRVLIAALLMLVLTVLLSLTSRAAMHALTDGSGAASAMLGVVQALMTVLSGMVQAGFFASVYVELRRVREGFAVPMLAEVFA